MTTASQTSVRTVPLEREIKAALIDRALESGDLKGGGVIISEMPVELWSRRVDLVVANGKLHAIEIKSDADSLKRLAGQVETYDRLFDKVTVVCGPKTAAVVREQTPEHVGLLVADNVNGRIVFREVRRGRTQVISDRRALLALLWRREIEALLRKHGVKFEVTAFRDELVGKAAQLPISTIRTAVLSCVKQRYRAYFEEFQRHRRRATTAVDLGRLQRGTDREPSVVRTAAPSRPRARPRPKIEANPSAVAVDAERLRLLCGDLPADLPRVVLKRI